jgi:cysteine desulfurase/selenocysteine lyase
MVASAEHGGQARDAVNFAAIRDQFPTLKQTVHGKGLVYLDSAATTQKPLSVIDAVAAHYRDDCSNIHRGVHTLSQRATRAYEDVRGKVQRYIGAEHASEVVFTTGTTAGINLVAQTYGRTHVGPGDEILVTEMEHHSNIVPWQILCEEKGATLKFVPLQDDGSIRIEDVAARLSDRTRLVSVVHISNALGTVNPVEDIIALAHAKGIPVLLDGAQAIAHRPLDVKELDCDFYTFSGHKLYGPTGTGILYGKKALLDAMPPWQGGGDMIRTVSFQGTAYAEPPARFEAGTPNIAGGIGLGAAIDFVSGIGREAIHRYEDDLLAYGTALLEAIPGLTLIGTAPHKAAVLSFVLEGIHPHDVGTLLDMEGVAVRTGHHCTQPVMDRFRISATTRASIGIYTNRDDLDRLAAAILKAQSLFG